MVKKFDFLIVGAGLYGSVFAHELRKIGKKCLVIDKRNHIAGNIFTEKIEDINVHKYGAHIFHTSNKKIWDYVNSFIEFKPFVNSPLANYKGMLYNLPFNMNTFYQLWGVKTPEEARIKIEEQVSKYSHIKNPSNLEEQALVLAGDDIYEKLIKGYTEKQWGRPATEIPSFIIRRLPFRFTFDNNYFNDTYQGIPIGGYTRFIQALLEDVEVLINTDYFEDRSYFNSLAENVLYTGKIDEYFDFKFGRLEYRSLYFENEMHEHPNYQGNAVVNYTDKSVPFTRIIEHKHFENLGQSNTYITREYPHEFSINKESYYPINDEKNQLLFSKYSELACLESNMFFGGRLADYKYYDMHQVIDASLSLFKRVYDDNNK